MERLKQQYATRGIRHSVDALPIVYEHGHPHVLIFQIGMSYFKLPGGRLRPGESDHDGLLRKLDTNLAPDDAKLKPDWRIGTERDAVEKNTEAGGAISFFDDLDVRRLTNARCSISGPCVATYWRPGFDNMLYPYKPAHIERPKEVRKLYVIQMPEKSYLSVPSNYKLIAVPLFELHDHIQRYGPVIAQVPTMLSRLDFVMAEGIKEDEDLGADGVKVEEKSMVLS